MQEIRPVPAQRGFPVVVVLLLAGILLALIVLLTIIVMGRVQLRTDEQPVTAGQTLTRDNLTSAPQSPKPLSNPDRIKETLREGATYHVVLKAGFTARVEDKDYSARTVTNLTYAAEFIIDRKIESNDGKRIVELRHFTDARNVKLLADVEGSEIELGLPGQALLAGLEWLQPGLGSGALALKPVAESLLAKYSQEVAKDRLAGAFGSVDSLAGKRIRITYVDGLGVDTIQPVGCELDARERDFLFTTAVLSDTYLFPDLKVKTGQTWTADGRNFSGFLDPSLRGLPEGQVTISRENDESENKKLYARLKINDGYLEVNASDDASRRIGSFVPRGTLQFDLQDGFVHQALLSGSMRIEEVSRNHILFEASFRSEPKLRIVYSCTMR